MQTIPHDEDPAAVRLILAVTRLRARLREESTPEESGLSLTQLSILKRLHRSGPTTAASLAAVEHVSQQAVAQSVAAMRAAGLVDSEPDPSDRRKTLVGITDAGLEMRATILASRDSWLARAIDATADAKDRAALERAIGLLERLVDVDI
jgi:DNA-binding MarR family transcriptional regulator